MRRYITEKVGILEIFQIILVVITLSLGYHAVISDIVWNNKVDSQGINICIDINKEIHHHNTSLLQITECTERLDIKNEDECKEFLEQTYLKTLPIEDKFKIVEEGGTKRDMKKFIEVNLRRQQASETSFVISINCIAVILVVHILYSTFGSNLDLRTKWNASLQGIILFACGFSTMLLAIALSTIDYKYFLVTNKIGVCGVLRFCDRNVEQQEKLPKNLELIINNVLHKFSACQEFRLKESMWILLMIIIGTCIAMILLAMDLTTKYEQENDEQELLEREAHENLDSLLEDQTVVFERSEDTPAPDDNLLVPPRGNVYQHFKTGSTVISEYLGVTRTHS